MSVIELDRVTAGPDYERGDFCHAAREAPKDIGLVGGQVILESVTFCGKVIREPWCCSSGAPSCGRESCPACVAIMAELGL
jgi:hypothetical protein